NCYAYVSEGECLVVDPGGSGAQVAEHVRDARVTCVAATHGHGDHVGGVAALVRATGAPFAIHAADASLAARAGQMSEVGRSYDEDAPAPDRALSEGDVLRVGTATFTVMETPGHTPGGVVLVGGGSAEGVAFVGDTLFPGSHGRTDLSGGDEAQIMASLARMADLIAPETTLLCGHGPATTMARELATNPFLR
ncbi:MAG TPA: MBL fold metallo-hydrolase, partial [Candidatus Olsenella avistercoris]|nr:MBL fold metallo-hydrolase [Candidatus Olsenella avistercoris]